MATALMSVPSSKVTMAAKPFGYAVPAPPSSAAWKKLPLPAAWNCTVISPGAPCCISTEAIWPLWNSALIVRHTPSPTPITALEPE
jgi:hypothetical protein